MRGVSSIERGTYSNFASDGKDLLERALNRDFTV